jgi:hypothetical protein
MPCSASHAKFLAACVATLGPICRFLFISSRLISCYYTSVPSSNTDEYYTSYIVIYTVADNTHAVICNGRKVLILHNSSTKFRSNRLGGVAGYPARTWAQT